MLGYGGFPGWGGMYGYGGFGGFPGWGGMNAFAGLGCYPGLGWSWRRRWFW